jgi:hypothetical protein
VSRVLSAAEIGRLVDVTAQLGPWAMPVVEALKSGIIAVQFLHRTGRAPLGDMRRSTLPLLAWIGDDDDEPTGPDAWRPALAAIDWARGAMLHAAGGEATHYANAVLGTLATGRLLLIETSTAHVEAWAAALRQTPTLIIVPRDGKPHPIYRPETRH